MCIAEAAQLACQGQGLNATGADPQYVDSITQAIKVKYWKPIFFLRFITKLQTFQGLKEGSDNLTPAIPPEGLANMFAGLQLNEVCTRFSTSS